MEPLRSNRRFIVVCILIGGCAPPETEAPDFTVRDSAGAQIVENRIELERLPEWRPAAPDVRIGTVEGAPEQQLHEVRDATLLPDRRLVVVNGGSHEVRVYGADGTHLVTFGGEGEGPEDMMWPSAVLAEGDSLFVRSRGRISIWTVDGELRETRPPPAFVGWSAWLTGGVPAIASTETIVPDVEGGMARHPFTVQVGSDTLVRYRGPRFVRVPSERLRLRSVHFAAFPEMDAHGDRVYATSGEERVVHVFRSDGTRLRSIRWDGPSLEIRPGDYERYRDSTIAESPRAADGFDDVPVAETFPALSDLHAATDGALWVRRYDRPEHPPGQRWLVFDSSGRLVARAALPESAELLEVGSEHVTLLERDELDVEYVAVYSKPSPP